MLVFFVGLTVSAQTIGNLADVKVINVGKMAGSDRAERFRSLVGKALSDRGFIATGSENADVTLIGVLTVSAQQETSGVSTSGVITVTPPQPKLYCECKTVLKNKDWSCSLEMGRNRWIKATLGDCGA